MKYPQHFNAKLEWTRLRCALRPGNFSDNRETTAPPSPMTPRVQCWGFVR